jgi:hypothetical protein
MTIAEIIAAYDAPVLDIQELALLIIINCLYRRLMTADELYMATPYPYCSEINLSEK